jgi:hypothetical protein
VRESAAGAWCDWEDVHISLDPKHSPSPRYRDPEFRLLFATLVIHYWKHAGFIDGDGILANMERISHIPGVLIHGRLDVSSPLETAWELHKIWPASELVVVDVDGHGGETMAAELTRAIARVSTTWRRYLCLRVYDLTAIDMSVTLRIIWHRILRAIWHNCALRKSAMDELALSTALDRAGIVNPSGFSLRGERGMPH